jgi:2-methylisocitrate lyase-like PEP mutase family enzyme
MYDKRLKKFEEFQALHFEEGAFVTPSPWDAGTARILTCWDFLPLRRQA